MGVHGRSLSTAEVSAAVACLQRHVGMRCHNIYDRAGGKEWVIKLQRSGGASIAGNAEEESKVELLVSPGVRIHTTKFTRERPPMPSNFTVKLRRHVRGRRLEAVEQLGIDRIIILTFGSGEALSYIVVEFYAGGNMILCGRDWKVLTLLRSHRDDNKGVKIMARHPYPLDQVKEEQEEEGEEEEEAEKNLHHYIAQARQLSPFTHEKLEAELAQASHRDSLKMLIARAAMVGPAVAAHCLLNANLNPSRLQDENPLNDTEMDSVVAEIGRFEEWLLQCKATTGKGVKAPKGYIVLDDTTSKNAEQKKRALENAALAGMDAGQSSLLSGELYDTFCPIRFAQYKDRRLIEFNTFDEAVDQFYSEFEVQKQIIQRSQAESAALGKLDKVKSDLSSRMAGLENEATTAQRRAELIEYNLDAVQAVIDTINFQLGNGMDWEELWRVIRNEQRNCNPVASIIHSLDLQHNACTVILSTTEDDAEEDEMLAPAVAIELDLAVSAHANVGRHFSLKKKQIEKQTKTQEAAEKAVRAAEKKTNSALASLRSSSAIGLMRESRQPLWFERFYWFISSDGYLVVGGHDLQQSERIVVSAMRRGDLYVHADSDGALPLVVKNMKPGKEIPPATVMQAGVACLCRSSAWGSKVHANAFYVIDLEQVSKKTPDGVQLPLGHFCISGEKHQIPPSPLVMGFGFLFKLKSDELDGSEAGDDMGGLDVFDSVEDEAILDGASDVTAVVGSAEAEDVAGANSGCESDAGSETINLEEERETSRKGSEEIEEYKSVASEPAPVTEEISEEEESVAVEGGRAADVAKAPIRQTRGRKKKEKKKKQKYGDQDEEDRTLAMRILGSAGESKKLKGRKGRNQQVNLQNERRKGARVPNIVSASEVRVLDTSSDDMKRLAVAESLIPIPALESEINYALPVCAPYTAMQRWKFKVKLVPGSGLKKGKTAKLCMDIFSKSPATTLKELDAMRLVQDVQMANSLIVQGKVSVPGLTKLQSEQRKSKKSKGKK